MPYQFFLLFVFCFGADPLSAKPSQKAEAALSGTWKIVSAHHHGKLVPAQFLKDLKMRVTITAERITLAYFWDRARSESLAYRLDNTRKPAWITGLIPGEKDRMLPGIYKMEGGR